MNPEIVLQADRIEWVGGVAVATGHVRTVAAGFELTADAARMAGDSITLTHVVAVSPAGSISATQIEFHAGDPGFSAQDARFERNDGVVIVADVLTVRDDALSGTHVEVFPCACDGPDPWSVRAAALALDGEGHLSFRKALLRVFDVPVLPLPGGRITLGRHSGPRFPEVGFSDDGARVAAPLFFAVGPDVDLVATPELRTERGAAGTLFSRWAVPNSTGTASGTLAWDTSASRLRGIAGASASVADSVGYAAVDGSLPSDPDWLADWGTDYLTRSTPWSELRAAAGSHGWSLGSDVFTAPAVTTQQLAVLSWDAPTDELPGGFVVRGQGVAAANATGIDPWQVGAPTPLGAGFVDVSRPTRAGPLVVVPRTRVDAAALRDDTRERSITDVAAVATGWRSAGGAVERLEPGWHASSAWEDGLWTLRSGPLLTWRRTGTNGSSAISGAMDVGDGPVSGSARANVDSGGWSAATQVGGTPGLVLVTAARTRGPIRPQVGWATAPTQGLSQLGGTLLVDLPGPLRNLTVGAGAGAEVDEFVWVHRSASLMWRHPTGCAAFGMEGRLEVDRNLPTLAVRVDVAGPKR